jgi:GTP-binding protein
MMMTGLAEARDEAERDALIEAGRLLFARPCTFFYAAQTSDQLPPPGLPEWPSAGGPMSASRR